MSALPGFTQTGKEETCAYFCQPQAKKSPTGHSTAAQAATLARDAGVTALALVHFSTRYPVGVLRDEARAIFPNTVLPRDFDTIEVPFPERGEPELIRWEDRQAAEREANADSEETEAVGDTAR